MTEKFNVGDSSPMAPQIPVGGIIRFNGDKYDPGQPQLFLMTANSWYHPGVFLEGSFNKTENYTIVYLPPEPLKEGQVIGSTRLKELPAGSVVEVRSLKNGYNYGPRMVGDGFLLCDSAKYAFTTYSNNYENFVIKYIAK